MWLVWLASCDSSMWLVWLTKASWAHLYFYNQNTHLNACFPPIPPPPALSFKGAAILGQLLSHQVAGGQKKRGWGDKFLPPLLCCKCSTNEIGMSMYLWKGTVCVKEMGSRRVYVYIYESETEARMRWMCVGMCVKETWSYAKEMYKRPMYV